MPARTGRWRATSTALKRSSQAFRRPALARGCFTGRMATSAGSSVIEKIQARTTPTAVKLPSSWNGGESLKLSVRKPTTVVRLVRNTGFALRRMASISASSFSLPWRIDWNSDTRMCIESATASVRMIVGADALVGSRSTPMWPAIPSAVTVENPITPNVATSAVPERRKSPIVIMNVRNISGITTGMSRMGASAKAQLSMDRPATWISNSGCASLYSATRPRAYATVCANSSLASPRSEMRTFTPVVRASGAISRPSSSGSASDTRLARSTTSGVMSPRPTRSSTISSSPFAHVCWKFVMASTRVENGICHASSVSARITSRFAAVNTSPALGFTMNSTLSFFV